MLSTWLSESNEVSGTPVELLGWCRHVCGLQKKDTHTELSICTTWQSDGAAVERQVSPMLCGYHHCCKVTSMNWNRLIYIFLMCWEFGYFRRGNFYMTWENWHLKEPTRIQGSPIKPNKDLGQDWWQADSSS